MLAASRARPWPVDTVVPDSDVSGLKPQASPPAISPIVAIATTTTAV